MRRFFFFVLTLLVACAASAGLAGCPATATLGIQPITGVGIPISTLLLESNLGCGYGPNEVYAYAVAISYPLDDSGLPSIHECPYAPDTAIPFVPGAVFPCYASATFGNLPVEDAGEGGVYFLEGGVLPDGSIVRLWGWVVFYNYETYQLLGKKVIEETAAHSDICRLNGTWLTACTATEQNNIVANMACDPLVVGMYPPEIDAGPGDARAPDAPTDAPGDAPVPEAGPDAADGGVDAPTDATLG